MKEHFLIYKILKNDLEMMLQAYQKIAGHLGYERRTVKSIDMMVYYFPVLNGYKQIKRNLYTLEDKSIVNTKENSALPQEVGFYYDDDCMDLTNGVIESHWF